MAENLEISNTIIAVEYVCKSDDRGLRIKECKNKLIASPLFSIINLYYIDIEI